MSAAFAEQRRIRIVRPELQPGRQVYFQREWEPVFCPDPPRRAEPERAGDANGAAEAASAPRLPRRYHSAVAGTALTVALTGVVSLGMVVRTAGLTLDAGLPWLGAWQHAALIAVPTRFVLAPLVSRLVGLFVEAPLR